MVNGTLIKQLREEKGLTQSDLGAKIGTDGNVVSRWERKKATPSNQYLSRLADFFERPIDDFMKGDKDKLDIKERSVTENRGTLTFEFDSRKLEVPATEEFAKQFWERVDRIIDLSMSQKITKEDEPSQI